MTNEYLNTWLLVFVNIFLAIIIYNFLDLKNFVRETRRKLDKHVEDFQIHGFHNHKHEEKGA